MRTLPVYPAGTLYLPSNTSVASTMQHTRILRLEICFWRDVASWWHVELRGWQQGSQSERCCIMVECGRKRIASRCLLHQWCNKLWFWGERCCITVECGRKRLSSRRLLHRWCNRIGFRGWRDVFGEVLHHGGLWEEEESEWTFVASMMQHTRVLRLERWVWRGVASWWLVGGRG